MQFLKQKTRAEIQAECSSTGVTIREFEKKYGFSEKDTRIWMCPKCNVLFSKDDIIDMYETMTDIQALCPIQRKTLLGSRTCGYRLVLEGMKFINGRFHVLNKR